MSESANSDDTSTEVQDDDTVYRRIAPDKLVPTDGGGMRIGSHAFRNLDGEQFSGHLESIMRALEWTPEHYLEGGKAEHWMVSFSVRFLRDNEQDVVLAPTKEDPAHIHVVGPKSKKRSRQFAENATIVLPRPNS